MNAPVGKPKTGSALRLLIFLGIVASAVVLAACGSSSDSTTGSSDTGSSSEVTEGSDTGGGPDPDTVYVEGVPTLSELYEGSEELPPKSGPPAKKGTEVIFVTCGLEAEGCANPAKYFVEAADALGWKSRIIDGKLNQDGYINGVRTAIAAQPDAIVMYGINCDEVTQPLREAKAAGIPVAEASSVDCDDPRVGGEDLYTIDNWFSKDAKGTQEFYEQYGINQADYLINATEGKAKVILAPYLGLHGKNTTDGWKKELAKCDECEIVEELPWEVTEYVPNGPLFQKFTTSLLKHPEANSVLLPYDDNVTYTGMSKAVADAGRDDMIVVSGQGFAAATEYIRRGEGLTADAAAYDNRWASWDVADLINRHLSGAPAMPQGVGFVVIDKDHNLPPAGQDYATEIDYQKAYEDVWNGK